MSNFRLIPSSDTVITIIATALGLMGLGGGVCSFISPRDAIKLFGLIPPAPLPSDKVEPPNRVDDFDMSMVRVYGIRNVGSGLSTIGLTALWKLSPAYRDTPALAGVAKTCVGISLTIGAVVAMGDAWIVRQFANSQELDSAIKKTATEASTSHAVISIPIFATGLACLLL